MAETYFYRKKKECNYTVLDNTFIRDTRLSLKAKGLMTYLLSLPEDWKIYLKEIQTHSTDGETSLRSAIKELKKYGYIKFKRIQNEKGIFVQGVYTIIENPSLENPKVENPKVDKQALLNTDNNKDLNNLKQTCASASESKNSKEVDEPPTPEAVYNEYHENKYDVSPERFWELNNDKKWKNGLFMHWREAYKKMTPFPDEAYNPRFKFRKEAYKPYSGPLTLNE